MEKSKNGEYSESMKNSPAELTKEAADSTDFKSDVSLEIILDICSKTVSKIISNGIFRFKKHVIISRQ